MSKVFSLSGIGSVASIVALAFFVYYQFFVVEALILEIKTINEEELTKVPEIKNFKGTFTYQDSTVNSLWKIRLSIKNIGSKTFVGEGNNKDIIGDTLGLYVPNEFRIIDIQQRQEKLFLNIDRINSSSYQLKFKQWKPTEFVELIAFVEGENRNGEPLLRFNINEREILNGEVKAVDFKVADTYKDKSFMSNFSKGVQTGLWWFVVIINISVFILILITNYSNASDVKQDSGTILLIAIVSLLPLIFLF